MWSVESAMKTLEKDATAEGEKRGRKASKETRRLQLIEATIDSLAKRGYSETTMADVADGAGLSRGIVNFHFESKEKLLIATLQHMADEYSAHWRAILQKVGDDPARQLYALVLGDFDRTICNKRKLAAWCAFWGEAKSRPTYQALCGANDEAYQNVFIDLTRRLKDDGGYDFDAVLDRARPQRDAGRPLAAADDGYRRCDPRKCSAGCRRLPFFRIPSPLSARDAPRPQVSIAIKANRGWER